MLKCIINPTHGGFGAFKKDAYDYLINKYGADVANDCFCHESPFIQWNTKTKQKEVYYKIRGDRDMARFNSYLIEVVENIETNYRVVTGQFDIDDYDGFDKHVRVIFL